MVEKPRLAAEDQSHVLGGGETDRPGPKLDEGHSDGAILPRVPVQERWTVGQVLDYKVLSLLDGIYTRPRRNLSDTKTGISKLLYHLTWIQHQRLVTHPTETLSYNEQSNTDPSSAQEKSTEKDVQTRAKVDCRVET